MRKVVISTCYGGAGVSEAAGRFMAEKGSAVMQDKLKRFEAEKLDPSINPYNYGRAPQWDGSLLGVSRDDTMLVQAVETLGDAANGSFAQLKIVEIPDDVEWAIAEYDGAEWVEEVHRTWG